MRMLAPSLLTPKKGLDGRSVVVRNVGAQISVTPQDPGVVLGGCLDETKTGQVNKNLQGKKKRARGLGPEGKKLTAPTNPAFRSPTTLVRSLVAFLVASGRASLCGVFF
jgi:hypothetical protein